MISIISIISIHEAALIIEIIEIGFFCAKQIGGIRGLAQKKTDFNYFNYLGPSADLNN